MAEIPQPNTAWRLDWRELPPHERWNWWEQLWKEAVRLRKRYRLVLRSEWWQDDIQVETLAALAALVNGYDSGAWNDPLSKLRLLYELDQIRSLLRGGEDVFDPDRDRGQFTQHQLAIGCEPDDGTLR
jgi:pullulanase/glycogen debranching enzyme